MSSGGVPDFWFNVVTPGLTESEAERVVDFVRRETECKTAFVIDPKWSMGIFLDRSTVEGIVSAIRADSESRQQLPGVIELFEEWLAFAEPEVERGGP